MPSGYTCCTTGYFCQPDEECWLDTGSLTQYCIAADSDRPDATRSAEMDGAQETGGGDRNGDDDEDDDDKEDGATRVVESVTAMSLVVGISMAMVMI